jgi:hypothetical protein
MAFLSFDRRKGLAIKNNFFIAFAIASIVCFFGEIYEIASGENLFWSDHLHNLLDHVGLLIINYIGMKIKK